ncbi:UDP-N-acetylglucosamine--N-acetylmuramyl-(pentapeptide) pyrophosphoryl-undecaprenol N-acetylglucosamine transferase [Alphaproteobacteria bacterium]|nr:UDP-N-acetylglucosamine--N-acetylmuramyl-(pentapeptide) pyrophosphoryl-undecaprenol N-acetylglucosamine transferase [Alphaproteobacteria bacterium]GHS97099.1 UDP-N-acetylglucosamine--N-acetylmuramyl-(pentapeptide) pyrophosphoryl-undecaprenol N-acetylglucosamine transferase [Alphaproteobacteria bacterium]
MLAAGGTGGHVFPALSLARVLKQRGHRVVLFTDERAEPWVQPQDFARIFVTHLKKTHGRTTRLSFALRLLGCGVKSLAFFVRHRPAVVVGFGGYPSAPTVLAAQWLRIPFVLHECNALLGRANERLMPKARAVTTGFPEVSKIDAKKQIFVGNPLRQEFEALKAHSYEPPQKSGPLNLLVLGGSQGSHIFSSTVPLALQALPQEFLRRLSLVQQVREADAETVKHGYARLGVSATLRPFFKDVAQQLDSAHMIISRSGALTLAEIAAAGLPSILVPLAHSRDGDQFANASHYRDAGAAVLMEEKDFVPEKLKNVLLELFENAEVLKKMSLAARKKACFHATEKMADEVDRRVWGRKNKKVYDS